MIEIYFQLGLQHILDYFAYDHILFVMALCAVYEVKDWKKVLVLVTAFTIGHSLTLFLSVFNIIHINKSLVETLIPMTIIFTCLYNIFIKRNKQYNINLIFFLVAFFGLIHGLGFSNYLNELLGQEESRFLPLLGFNVGVECGQIIIVLISMVLSYLFLTIIKVKQQYWVVAISVLAILVAIQLLTKI